MLKKINIYQRIKRFICLKILKIDYVTKCSDGYYFIENPINQLFYKNKKTGHCIFFNDVKQTKKELAESLKSFQRDLVKEEIKSVSN